MNESEQSRLTRAQSRTDDALVELRRDMAMLLCRQRMLEDAVAQMTEQTEQAMALIRRFEANPANVSRAAVLALLESQP